MNLRKVSGETIIDAEIVEEENVSEETRAVQVTPELEIERLKTKRAELATVRTRSRWNVAGTVVVLSAAFASCAQMCNPW